MSESLTDILNKNNSDKGTMGKDYTHGYSVIYDEIFNKFKDDEINLLEIGIIGSNPLSSVKSWLEYFKNAKIYGFDLENCDFKSDRFIFTKGNQSDESDLQKVIDKCNKYKIIIDDGSHNSGHQLISFNYLFPHLESGGVYCIEDTNCVDEKHPVPFFQILMFGLACNKIAMQVFKIKNITAYKNSLVVIEKL